MLTLPTVTRDGCSLAASAPTQPVLPVGEADRKQRRPGRHDEPPARSPMAAERPVAGEHERRRDEREPAGADDLQPDPGQRFAHRPFAASARAEPMGWRTMRESAPFDRLDHVGWALGYNMERDRELLDLLNGALLVAGKALYLATHFERNLQFVLRTMDLVNGDDPLRTLEDALVNPPKDKLLGPTLRDLERTALNDDTNPFPVLERARAARNFIAHEGGFPASLWSIRRESVHDHVAALHSAVVDLVAGDNIVSKWVYGIEEPREPPPLHLVAAYPRMVEEWVFGSFWKDFGGGPDRAEQT
jgi:hypothetical protein